MAKLRFAQLDPAVQAQLRRAHRLRPGRGVSREEIRRQAIAVLHTIQHLSRRDRVRVLNHALKVNDV